MKSYSTVLTQVTDRDLRLFLKLNVAGWLTTPQIGTYFFPGKSLNAVSKRMRKLVAAGYVAEAQVSSTETKFYRLAGRGTRVLLEQVDATQIIRSPSQLPRKLRHFTAVNDLRVAFEMALRTPDFTLAYFHAEREYPCLERQFPDARALLLQGFTRYQLIPDALASLQSGKQTRTFAIEYDTGSEPSHFFGYTKMRLYQECFTQVSVPSDTIIVLVIVPTLKRLLSLMRQVVQVHPPPRRFFFALLAKFNARTWIEAPIFLDPTDYYVMTGQDGRAVVVEKVLPDTSLPKHTLGGLLTASPDKLSSREESHMLHKTNDNYDFALPFRAH